MYKDLLKYLCCPICKKPLRLTIGEENKEEVIAGVLSCEACHAALIREGVVDFQSKEQELTNTWSKYYEKEDYASVDERMDHQKNEEQKQQEEKVKECFLIRMNGLRLMYLIVKKQRRSKGR